MSSIFKTRKVPKHLIIEDDAGRRGRSPMGPARILRWVLVVAVVTVLFVQYTGGQGL